MSGRPQPFLDHGLGTVPRALGFCDRDTGSKTFGCCDRAYWHYHLADFPNARFQEAGWLFALAYSTQFEGNIYHSRKRLAEWVRGIWSYWLASRNNDGSTNELYPGERCFCSTAFSAAAFVESQLLLRGEGNGDEVLAAAAKTMEWLVANRNDEIPNQMASSYVALLGFALLTGKAEHRQWADRRRTELLGLADADGIFPEYGGFDSGYQSITMSALRRALIIGGEDDGIDSLLRCGEESFAGRVDREGGFDPSQNSRGPQYLFPSAFVPGNGPMKEIVEAQISQGRFLLPSAMDDRYCLHLAIDFLCAGLGQ